MIQDKESLIQFDKDLRGKIYFIGLTCVILNNKRGNNNGAALCFWRGKNIEIHNNLMTANVTLVTLSRLQ